jgi:dihydropteroate synthase
MGILNATPDSFYDGGRHADLSAAVAQGRLLAAEGASVIDVGGQSTRPGHTEISAEEECARVVPLIAALRRAVSVPLSVDTYKPAVARAALAAGAEILNDVHGFQGDPALPEIAAAARCGVVLMHQEASLRDDPGDPLPRVIAFLARSIEIAVRAGVARDRLVLDPGIGFGKTQAQNLTLLARLGELHVLGLPLLLGASRKSVLHHVLALPPEERLEATLTTTALGVAQGVAWFRVHDVQANLRAARMAHAIRGAATFSP